MSRARLNLSETDPDKFLLRSVTMDETWVHHFHPRVQQQSKQWKYSGLPPSTERRQSLFRQLGRSCQYEILFLGCCWHPYGKLSQKGTDNQ